MVLSESDVGGVGYLDTYLAVMLRLDGDIAALNLDDIAFYFCLPGFDMGGALPVFLNLDFY